MWIANWKKFVILKLGVNSFYVRLRENCIYIVSYTCCLSQNSAFDDWKFYLMYMTECTWIGKTDELKKPLEINGKPRWTNAKNWKQSSYAKLTIFVVLMIFYGPDFRWLWNWYIGCSHTSLYKLFAIRTFFRNALISYREASLYFVFVWRLNAIIIFAVLVYCCFNYAVSKYARTLIHQNHRWILHEKLTYLQK